MTNAIQNPFRALRLENDESLVILAKKIPVSKQALIRLEQGTYSDPLPSVLNYYSKNYHLSEHELSTRYALFQKETRSRGERYFGDVRDKLQTPITIENISSTHPLRLLRGNRSCTQVAKDLCIPQATLTYFERNVVQQKSTPKVLTQVMREVGHYASEVQALKDAYDEYRLHVITYRESNGLRVDYGYQSVR